MKEAKFVISKSKVLEQYEKIERIADLASYSSKTNPIITPILEENTSCLFSIHMPEELVHVTDKSRVLFLAQGWNEQEIYSLTKQGIDKFVVDNEKDLEILLSWLEKSNAKIELMLRAKLKEHTLRTERHFVFGMPCEVVNQKILELKENKNVAKLGIHFHRKTQNMAEWNLIYEIENMFEKKVLETIDYMNIGGGLPSIYANTNVDVIKLVLKKIRDVKGFLNKKNVKLMAEPGRFIAAPAGKLITYIKAVYDNNIIVNASVYNSDMDAVIVPVKLLVEGEHDKEEGKGKPYYVKGCTPCSIDLFRYRVYLENPKPGDKLVFLNAGAYNFSSDFCDLEKLETEIIE